MDEFESDIIKLFLSFRGTELLQFKDIGFCNDLLDTISLMVPIQPKMVFKQVEYHGCSRTRRVIAKYYIRIGQIISAVISTVQPMMNGQSWLEYTYTSPAPMCLDEIWIQCLKKIHSLVDDNLETLFTDTYENNQYSMSEESKNIYNRLIQLKWTDHICDQTFQQYMKSIYTLRDKLFHQQVKLLNILSLLFQHSKLVVLTLEEIDHLFQYTKEQIQEFEQIKETYFLDAFHHFEVFVETQKLNQTISRIKKLEQSLDLFF
jgi:hypothetical protein